MNLEKMDALIASWQDEILDTLRGWIAVDSVKADASGANAPYGAALRKVLDRFLADAKRLGFAVDDVDGYAGSAQMGAGDQTLGILAHLDIVPAGDGWVHDPFAGEIEGGKMFGRGVADDKGPAVAALYAMRAVKEAGIPLKHAVRLIVGCDEETGMSDMVYYASARAMPDYGFSPDAEYPLINVEKGGIGLKLIAVTGGEENADIPVYSLYAGLRQNVVPGLATAEIGLGGHAFGELADKVAAIQAAHDRFDLVLTDIGGGRAKLTATGIQCHAAMPEQGLNAAGMLLVALSELNAGGGSRTAIAALAQLIGVDYTGQGLGLAQSDELSGPLTCNLGILRYDGQVLTAQLDIRYPLCADETALCGSAVMALSDYGIAVSRTSHHVPLHVPAEHPVVQGLLEVYRELTGLPAEPMSTGGGTYSRMMPNTVAFGSNFPGDPDCAHMPDEFVEIKKLMLNVKIMAHAIVKLAGASL